MSSDCAHLHPESYLEQLKRGDPYRKSVYVHGAMVHPIQFFVIEICMMLRRHYGNQISEEGMSRLWTNVDIIKQLVIRGEDIDSNIYRDNIIALFSRMLSPSVVSRAMNIIKKLVPAIYAAGANNRSLFNFDVQGFGSKEQVRVVDANILHWFAFAMTTFSSRISIDYIDIVLQSNTRQEAIHLTAEKANVINGNKEVTPLGYFLSMVDFMNCSQDDIVDFVAVMIRHGATIQETAYRSPGNRPAIYRDLYVEKTIEDVLQAACPNRIPELISLEASVNVSVSNATVRRARAI